MMKKWQIAVVFLGLFLTLMLLSPTIIAGSQQAAQAATSETYSYDRAGRLTGVSYADGSGIDYSYDANGSILSVTVRAGDGVFEDSFE